MHGGSQWPPCSIWYQVATILSAWILVEDWEAVDRLPASTEKALQAVNSCLLNKAACTAAGPTGWIFLTALKGNMDHALCNAAPVHRMQRCLEELEQCILTLGACGPKPIALKNPSSLTVRQGVTVMMNIMRLRITMMDVVRLRIPAWQ